MRRSVVLLALLLPFFLNAQEKRLSVRSFDINPYELRAKTAPVYDQNHHPSAMISIFLPSEDSVHFAGNIIGEPMHNPGEWIVFMPTHSEWIDITVDGCEALHYVFPSDKPLMPAYGYTLYLDIFQSESIRTLILPTLQYHPSHTSYGLMVGLCKKNGGYVRVVTDFHRLLNPSSSCSGDGTVNGETAWFTGASRKSRFAITGGYLRQLAAPLYLYVGGGYGSRILAWEMYSAPDEYQYTKVTTHSYTGIETECGILFRIHALVLSAGIRTNQFKFYEACAGLGVLF